MDVKKIALVGAAVCIPVATYTLGKIVGCIKTLKFEVDIIEETCPGFKENVIKGGIKGATKEAIETIFYSEKNE